MQFIPSAEDNWIFPKNLWSYLDLSQDKAFRKSSISIVYVLCLTNVLLLTLLKEAEPVVNSRPLKYKLICNVDVSAFSILNPKCRSAILNGPH